MTYVKDLFGLSQYARPIMLFLRFVFVAQLLVMLSSLVLFLVTPADFQSVALLFYLVIIGAVAAVYAAWQFIRHPTRRLLASAVIATPVFCLSTPFVIVALNGSPVRPAVLVATVIAVLAIAAFFLLGQPTRWRSGGIFTNRRFNIGFVIALGVQLALFWAPIIALLYLQNSIALPDNIRERDNVVLIGAGYFVTVAGPALLLALFMLLYAPVGLVRNTGGRLVHAGQLLLALVMLASLALGAFAVSLTMFNPG